MVRIYEIQSDGTSEPFVSVRCKSEDRELQLILDCNPDLLPGDQIRPDDPCRWLVIKREMPVPDPSSGEDRWSVDFLFADQHAMPTFIECKRFADTRSRREVVGQMFEYAANGHYYWTKDLLRDFAERYAEEHGTTLEDSFLSLEASDVDTVDAYFEKLQDNLREGQLRIVFFLEESPMELRSLVDFLNRQMERSEILLVEAQQFERDGRRCVVPVLFGYSEEARRVKRVVNVSTDSRPRITRQWDDATLFAEIESSCTRDTLAASRKLYESWQTLPCKIVWRGGPKLGGCLLVIPQVSDAGWLGLGNDGGFGITLGGRGINDTEKGRSFREQMMQALKGIGFSVPELYDKISHRGFKPDEWVPKVDELITVCRELVYDNN